MKGTKVLSLRQLNGYFAALSLSVPAVGTMTAALSGASALAADVTSNSSGRLVKFYLLSWRSVRALRVWGQGRHPEAAEEEALRTGLSLGMTLIDTAEIYGNGNAREIDRPCDCRSARSPSVRTPAGTLRNFGLKGGHGGDGEFETRIKELVGNSPELAALVEPLLVVRRCREQLVILHRRLLAIVRDDKVRQRLMMTPGVGPAAALTYPATVDVPVRFQNPSRSVPCLELVSSINPAILIGAVEYHAAATRSWVTLDEAAQSMLYSKKWSLLKAWATQIARRRG